MFPVIHIPEYVKTTELLVSVKDGHDEVTEFTVAIESGDGDGDVKMTIGDEEMHVSSDWNVGQPLLNVKVNGEESILQMIEMKPFHMKLQHVGGEV